MDTHVHFGSLFQLSPSENSLKEALGRGDDCVINETRKKPTIGIEWPSLSVKWHGVFALLSRIDTAGYPRPNVFNWSVRNYCPDPRQGGIFLTRTSAMSRIRTHSLKCLLITSRTPHRFGHRGPAARGGGVPTRLSEPSATDTL